MSKSNEPNRWSVERQLDEALADGFPASDPVAITLARWRRANAGSIEPPSPSSSREPNPRTTMIKNHNTLPAKAKSASTAVLSGLLADSVDLALLTKQAHWNIKGANFIALHEMIDRFRDDIDGHVDTIAERIVQLGAIAVATSQAIVEQSRLTAYPRDIMAEQAHLVALVERYALASSLVREGIDQCADAGDASSADLLTAYARALDKAMWFLEAHTG